MKHNSCKYLYPVFFLLTVVACNKKDFLNARPNDKTVVPETIADFQALLDYDQYMNGTSGLGGVLPSLGEVGTDGYYVTTGDLEGDITPLERNAYTWAINIYNGEPVTDWSFPYRAVLYANTAIEGINNIVPTTSEKEAWNNVLGSGLFFRGLIFYHLAQVFAPPYNRAAAGNDWGIPLRISTDVSEQISRSTLEQTYDQVIADVTSGMALLPEKPLYKTRPSKPAAYGLLARVYQTMGLYDKALLYADSCLAIQPGLMDYNVLDSNAYTPIARFNEEVIFHSILIDRTIILPTIAAVDTSLYDLYDADDLRKAVFFEPGAASGGGIAFTGTYDGSYSLFGGIATDEIYLIKAECLARADKVQQAMDMLNLLLQKRWRTGSFNAHTAQNADEALQLVLQERRKELLFRGLRWTDLRRLNQDSRFAVTIQRQPGDQQAYNLLPGDSKYTYPIPPDVISFNPSMPQNPR